MRIVTHSCSNTEIVAALGCGDQIVGADDHSDYPADVVARAAKVGPDLHVDVAKVAACSPDLVLYSDTIPGHDQALAELRAAGLPVEVIAPRSVDDVVASIVRIAELLGVPERGRVLADELRAGIGGDPQLSWSPKVLVEWWPKPSIAAGRRSWVHDLIVAAGGRNALDEDVASRPLGDDEAARLAPDLIVIAWCGVPLHKYRAELVLNRPTWCAVPAVRERAVVPITEAWLGRPGPRLVHGYRALRQALEGIV